MNGFNSAMVVPSTWKLRADPPRSTRVKGDIAKAAAATHFLARLGRAFDAAKHGFVNLNYSASAAHRGQRAIAHSFADAMAHEPRAFERNSQSAVKLIAR